MTKQLTINKNKRKSYMSQGFLMRRGDNNNINNINTAAVSKNPSINEFDGNHEIISNYNINDNNNNSGFFLIKDSKDKEQKDGFFKYPSKDVSEANFIRKNNKKKQI